MNENKLTDIWIRFREETRTVSISKRSGTSGNEKRGKDEDNGKPTFVQLRENELSELLRRIPGPIDDVQRRTRISELYKNALNADD